MFHPREYLTHLILNRTNGKSNHIKSKPAVSSPAIPSKAPWRHPAARQRADAAPLQPRTCPPGRKVAMENNWRILSSRKFEKTPVSIHRFPRWFGNLGGSIDCLIVFFAIHPSQIMAAIHPVTPTPRHLLGKQGVHHHEGMEQRRPRRMQQRREVVEDHPLRQRQDAHEEAQTLRDEDLGPDTNCWLGWLGSKEKMTGSHWFHLQYTGFPQVFPSILGFAPNWVGWPVTIPSWIGTGSQLYLI